MTSAAGRLRPQDRYLIYELVRMARTFEAVRVPLLGVVGDVWHAPVRFREFDARAAFVSAARGPGVTEREGVWALGRLQRQLAFLAGGARGEDAARAGMAALADAQRRLSLWHRRLGIAGSRGALARTAASATALETGLGAVAKVIASGVGQEDGNPDASARPPIDAAMDEWTQRAFQPPTGDPESERRRVLHFTNVLFGEGGFRHEPNEWLYDGFSKMDLASVLASRKGMPFALAALGTCLAARVSLPAAPLCAPLVARCQPGVFGCADAPAALTALERGTLQAPVAGPEDSERVRRYAARTSRYDSATSDKWVLRLGEGAAEAFVDASRPSPVPLSPEAAAQALFGRVLAQDLYRLHGSWEFMSTLSVDGTSLWAYLAGLVVQCYQRRGRSDDVASWVYVKMAVDVHAPEWEQFLSG